MAAHLISKLALWALIGVACSQPSAVYTSVAASQAAAAATTAYAAPLPAAEPPYSRVRYEPSTADGELTFAVSYTVWIPPGVKTLRGIIVHQHGCGEGACKAGRTAAFDLHWQALAAKHSCALLGPSYEQPETGKCALWCDPGNGSANRFLRSLTELSRLSGHAELETVPWALWGHSGGAVWAGTMLLMFPERVAAVWLRSGAPGLLDLSDPDKLGIPAAALQVPVMCNLGTQEGVTAKDGQFARVWERVQPFFLKLRSKSGLVGIAVDPLSSHECGNQRYLAIPWFDVCLTARLGAGAGSAVLRPMQTSDSWLASFLGTNALPAASYSGPVTNSIWLPNRPVAEAWTDYVRDTNVRDASPPPPPRNLRRSASGKLTWEADADLESGIAYFVVERNGVEIGRVPEKPTGTRSRPLFQGNSYSDTPVEPLVVMEFVDSKPADQAAVYRVSTVNTVGLRSEPAVLRE